MLTLAFVVMLWPGVAYGAAAVGTASGTAGYSYIAISLTTGTFSGTVTHVTNIDNWTLSTDGGQTITSIDSPSGNNITLRLSGNIAAGNTITVQAANAVFAAGTEQFTVPLNVTITEPTIAEGTATAIAGTKDITVKLTNVNFATAGYVETINYWTLGGVSAAENPIVSVARVSDTEAKITLTDEISALENYTITVTQGVFPNIATAPFAAPLSVTISGGSDTTPPAFLAGYPQPGAMQLSGSRQARVVIKSEEQTFKYYYVALENGSTPPTVEQIINRNYLGALDYKSGDVTSGSMDTGSILPNHNTVYDFWVVIADVAGNTNGPVEVESSTPLPADFFVSGYPVEGSEQAPGSNNVEILVKTQNTEGNAMVYYVVLSDEADAPIIKQVEQGQNSTGGGAIVSGSTEIIKGTLDETSIILNLPDAATPYDIYLVAGDTRNASPIAECTGIVKIDDVTTPDARALNPGKVGHAYQFQFATVTGGGTDTHTWTHNSGTITPGLSLNPSNGYLSGTPTTAGDYTFEIKVQDSWTPPHTAVGEFSIHINEPDKINISAIFGVTAPVKGAAPVTTITETDQFTGTVTWDPAIVAGGKFAASTIYTATITLIPKLGYTLVGVGEDFFTVAGADSVTNDADSGIVTAVFPKTAAASSGGSGGGALPGFAISTAGTTQEKYGAEVDIPRGAVSSDTRGDIDRFNSDKIDAPDDSFIPGNIFELTKKSSGDFLKPITLTLPYKQSAIDFEKYDLSICWYDEDLDEWVELDDVEIDEDDLTVSGETEKTGNFALIATKKAVVLPVEPPVESEPELPALTDISGHWAKASIEYLVEMGAISGYPDNTFRPDNLITRAEFATVLVKAMGLSISGSKVFADTTGHWAKEAISTAYVAGIISGYNEQSFGPDDPITREQMAVMVVKAAGLTGAAPELKYADSQQISAWAREFVARAAAEKLISGYPDNTFRPANKATRAEAVTVISQKW